MNIRKIKEYYAGLDVIKRVLFVTIIVQIIVLIIGAFCFFIGYFPIPCGFILGSVVADLNYVLLCKQMDGVLSDANTRVKARAARNYMLRTLLYILGLAIALIFYVFDLYIIDVFAVAFSYIIPKIVLYIVAGKAKD